MAFTGFILLLGGMTAAQALDLATFDVRSQGGSIGLITGARVIVVDQLAGPFSTPNYQLFSNHTFTPADVGSTFIATSANDPDFALFAQMVTNGVNDGFGYGVDNMPGGGGVGHSWTEANLFAAGTQSFGNGNFTSYGTLSGPDYAGYTITQVILRIDSFTLNTVDNFTNIDFQATATIVGVPEPGAAGLMVGGLAMVGLGRRRRR